MRRIFYVRRVDASLDSATVKDIVFKSQRNNRQKDVTGVLAHSGRHFAQVLVGTADNLTALADKIGRDKRHTEVTVLFDEPISTRDYGEWSMGFLYDAALSDEIEKALSDSTHPSNGRDRTLARKIFLHVRDLARP